MKVLTQQWGRLVFLGLLCLGVEAWSQDLTTNQSPVPFLNLRDRVLEYVGPEPTDPHRLLDSAETRIGWFGPDSLEDVENAPMWWAASLAVQQANERGDVQAKPVRLTSRWTTNVWQGGAALVSRLVYEDQVRVLIGSLDGPATHLAEQVVAKARLPLVSPVSTDLSVNLAGVAWMFSLAPDDSQTAALLASTISDAPSPDQRHVLFAATDHDSRLAAKAVRAALQTRGIVPDLQLEFSAGTKEFALLISRIPAGWKPWFLVLAGATDSARLIRSLRETGYRSEIVGSVHLGTLAFLAQVGQAGEGVLFPLLFEPRLASPDDDRFVALFQERFRQAPDYRAAYTYDAARLVIAALRTGAVHPGEIRNALRLLSPWHGITGTIEWDGLGQNIGWQPRMGTIRQGRIVPVSERVEAVSAE